MPNGSFHTQNGRLNAAVESEIVGYAEVEMRPGMQIVASGFSGLAEDTIDIQELVGDFAPGDEILFRDASGAYQRYGYYLNTYSDESYSEDLGAGWADAAQIRVKLPIGAGTAFWFNNGAKQTETTVVFSGKVNLGAQEIPCETGLNMVAFPVPIAVDLASVELHGSAVGTELLLYRADGKYERYAYYESTYADETYGQDLGPGWADTAQVRANVTISACEGFWLIAKGPVTMKISNAF